MILLFRGNIGLFDFRTQYCPLVDYVVAFDIADKPFKGFLPLVVLVIQSKPS